jgi:transcriptional regulator with XRE-family HTH domain
MIDAKSRYGVRMPDTTPTQDGSRDLATLLRQRRLQMQITQEDVADRAGISRQTYNKYERGGTLNPKPRELRAVCLVLKLDPREVPVALGFVTREEIDLPPQQPALPRSIRRILQLLDAEQVPATAKKRLLKIIDDAVDFWFETFGLPDIREPSADERAKGKPVSKR